MSKKIILTEDERAWVIRDSREKLNQGWMFKETDICKGTIVQKLPTGDYSLMLNGISHEDKFVIERKLSTSEISVNIYEERFEKELERLDVIQHAFIICEFTWNDVMMFPVGSKIPQKLWYKLKMTAEYMQSSLMRYMIKHKVKIIFAGNQGDVIAMQLMKHYMRECSRKVTNG